MYPLISALLKVFAKEAGAKILLSNAVKSTVKKHSIEYLTKKALSQYNINIGFADLGLPKNVLKKAITPQQFSSFQKTLNSINRLADSDIARVSDQRLIDEVNARGISGKFSTKEQIDRLQNINSDVDEIFENYDFDYELSEGYRKRIPTRTEMYTTVSNWSKYS